MTQAVSDVSVGQSEEVRRYGPATHRRVANLHVLCVEGTPYEMARQHGALLRDYVPDGPVPYYRTYIEKLARTAGAGPLSPALATVLRHTVGRRVARAIPPFARDVIRGLADGAGVDEEQFLEGCVMPDSMQWLASKAFRMRGVKPATRHRLALGIGCTSAIAWGEATRDGQLLHARNFDYHGVEAWPRSAAVVFHRPAQGLRYVSVAAAGIPMGGITAMNEAGLTLTVHQHMITDGARLGGTPIGVVGDIVMREAETLDQAQAILGRHEPIGCWTYLVGSAHEAGVLCFEENPERQVARRVGGGDGETTFGYANIYLDQGLGATERGAYGSYWRANLGRHQRANECLAAGAGHLDPDAMAAILADTGDDDHCRLRQPIAMLMTVASVVFRPGDGVVWVATGGTPTSHNVFEPFDLERTGHAPERGRLRGGVPADREAAAAFQRYRAAYLAYFERGDVAAARAHIAEAEARKPGEPLYRALAGFLALAQGDALPAWRAFDRALELGHPDAERLATFRLWRGRAADLCGRRVDAVADYRAALAGDVDPAVAKAAKRGLERRYRARDTRRIDIDFTYADVISP